MPVRLDAALAAEGETLQAGDRIVVVGDKENPARLATLALGSKAVEAST